MIKSHSVIRSQTVLYVSLQSHNPSERARKENCPAGNIYVGVSKHIHLSQTGPFILSSVKAHVYKESTGLQVIDPDSQRLLWSAISVSELRLSSAM